MGVIDRALGGRGLIKPIGGAAFLDLTGSPKEKLALPTGMQVLLERAPYTNSIRLTYPDGQTELIGVIPRTIRDTLASRGLPRYKLDHAIDYLWNFYSVYVECDVVPAPPQVPS